MRGPFLLLILSIFVRCSSTHTDSLKTEKYINQGRILYERHCSNCHQPDGTGLGKLIPPLNNDFPFQNLPITVCAIKYGLKGPINIEGQLYNREMPRNEKLTSLEIAQITTFVTNSWGQQHEITDVHKIDSLLKACH